MDRNLIFQHILTNKNMEKKTFKIKSLQYFENEPLNVLKLVVDRIYG